MCFAVIAGCTVSRASTPNSPPALPTATPVSVATVSTAVVVPQTSLPTRTVEATATVVTTQTNSTESVPRPRKEEETSASPNPTPSARINSGPNEVSGAHLTIYNCIGDNGGYCPDGSHTASGAPVAPGVAACDPKFMGMRFVIKGDPTATVWTCLDTGLFTSPLFDLWFYDLEVGRDYLNNISPPFVVSFVD